jgi:release factor glutamine methyltransferase
MPSHDWTIARILGWTTAYFTSHQIESARADAEILLAHALEMKRIDLYLQHDRPLSRDERKRFKKLIRRRIAREPVAYIISKKEFWSLDFEVTPDVLIPRPETECLVETVQLLLKKNGLSNRVHILELGTGSGALVLSIARHFPDHYYVATDISRKSLAVALKNADRYRLAETVAFMAADWLGAFKPNHPCFDLIVSNPPYIRSAEIESLQPEIARYEPCVALNGGDTGLSCLRRIIYEAPAYLAEGGKLVLEMGYDQKREIENLVRQCGRYEKAEFIKDYGKRDRVACLSKK